MSRMLFHAVHHIAIICGDYSVSRDFYVSKLGLRVLREHWRAERRSHKLDLDAGGGVQIELFSFPDTPPRPSHPEACGLRHLSWRVADLDTTVAALQAQGIVVEPVRSDPYTGARFTFFADPDGLPLELYESSP